MNKIRYACLAVFLYGCSELEYSPNQAFDKNSPTDLNSKNLTKLLQTPSDDTVRFVISGDSQRSLNELEDFVEKVNSMVNVDMVFLAGDISEFGTLQENEWVVKDFQNLNVPFFGVIGNHDLIANGSNVFKRMFGDLNYSFVYGGVKFICHDTNGREYKFNGQVPDIGWLQTELTPIVGVNSFVGISHIRPFSSDFDSKLDTTYTQLFNQKPEFLASFHAHDHSFGEFFPINSRIPFLTTTTIGNNGFLLVEIVNNKIRYERVEF